MGDGCVPKPKTINARRDGNRLRLDEAFATLPGDDEGLIHGSLPNLLFSLASPLRACWFRQSNPSQTSRIARERGAEAG
jgi:hypothetical protein